MTIHADWAKVIKQRYPECFTPNVPRNVNASCGIIDGHIQLMGAYNVSTWEQFLQNQFVRPVSQLFGRGCKVVVLLFDNRLMVSPYKGMTQYKRCKRYQDVHFSKADPLPQNIPNPWIDHMMNRNFKDKVISFVCERIQSLVQPAEGRTLIVDFKGPPKIYTNTNTCPQDIMNMSELGESDIKFARYVHMLGNSIVYATDGDYIPISLLYYAMHGVRPDNNIIIYRQEANVNAIRSQTPRGCPKGPRSGARAKASAATTAFVCAEAEREDPTNEIAEGPTGTTTALSAVAKPKIKKRMEFINLQPVLYALLEIMHLPPQPTPEAITGIVSMMLLAGTDYSRAIPLVGPRRLIEMVPMLTNDIVNIVQRTLDTVSPSPTLMTESLVHSIYKIAFKKYIQDSRQSTIESLLQSLNTSSISERNRTLLPTLKQIDTTCRNVAWVVHYWKDCINTAPDLSQPTMYGFVYDDSTRQFTWTDVAQDSLNAPPETMLTLLDPSTQITTATAVQLDNLKAAAAFIAKHTCLVKP